MLMFANFRFKTIIIILKRKKKHKNLTFGESNTHIKTNTRGSFETIFFVCLALEENYKNLIFR